MAAEKATVEAPVDEAGAKPSLRERILGAQDIRIEAVAVPEWGLDEPVYVRGLTGRNRDTIERLTTDGNFTFRKELFDNFRALFCAMAVVDADGVQVFTIDDVDALGDKSSVALQRVYDVAVRLSAVDAKAVDGMMDALKDNQSANTGSGSRRRSATSRSANAKRR
jgi:hypothetical protein